MNLFYVPHLEHMSLAKVAIAIYNASPSFDLEKEANCSMYAFSGEKLDTIFKDQMSQAHIPIRLQEMVLSLIKSIILEVEKWKMRHNVLDLNVDLREFLSWKSEGTIDRHRTAVKLIQKDILPIDKSFVLACLYCLSEAAESLWTRMSEEQRKLFVNENERDSSLVKYYIAQFRGMDIDLRVDYCQTVVSINRLLAQLSPEQRRLSLLIAVKRNLEDTHVLRYCLSQMEEKEQLRVLETYPFKVLSCFLEWPWQPLFIDVANRLWDYLSKLDFCSFLEFILIEKIESHWKDFDYEELLQRFWRQSPSEFKDYVKLNRNFDFELLTRILNKKKDQFQLS